METPKPIYKISAPKLKVIWGKVKFLETKMFWDVSSEGLQGLLQSLEFEGGVMGFRLKTYLFPNFLFLAACTIFGFTKQKRPWPKPVESVKRVWPFHLSSLHHRCYIKKKKITCWQCIPASLFRLRNLSCPKLKQLGELIKSYILSTCWPHPLKVCPGGSEHHQWELLTQNHTALERADIQLCWGFTMLLGGEIIVPGFEAQPPYCHVLHIQPISAPHK